MERFLVRVEDGIKLNTLRSRLRWIKIVGPLRNDVWFDKDIIQSLIEKDGCKKIYAVDPYGKKERILLTLDNLTSMRELFGEDKDKKVIKPAPTKPVVETPIDEINKGANEPTTEVKEADVDKVVEEEVLHEEVTTESTEEKEATNNDGDKDKKSAPSFNKGGNKGNRGNNKR